MAIAEEDIASRMINKETNGTWYFQPEKPKAKHIKADVPGGYAFRVKATKGANPWDVQASSPVAGAINEGDVIMLHYFARAEVPAEGGSALTARIQLAAAPYSSVLDMTSKISGEWKSYCAFRVASASIGENKSSVSIHLATAAAGHRSRAGAGLQLRQGLRHEKARLLRWLSRKANHSARRCASSASHSRAPRNSSRTGRLTFVRAKARKGKVFAVFALNHHGDGHVALWLNTPAMEQSRLIASAPKHIFKPQYVGPSGWIGVELNRGFSWKRVIELVHMAYVNSSPAKSRGADRRSLPRSRRRRAKMTPAEIDRLKAPKALKLRARMCKICLALPETDEARSSVHPCGAWANADFALLYDYGKGLTVSFWVGIERQGPLEMDPRFSIPPYLGPQRLDRARCIEGRE